EPRDRSIPDARVDALGDGVLLIDEQTHELLARAERAPTELCDESGRVPASAPIGRGVDGTNAVPVRRRCSESSQRGRTVVIPEVQRPRLDAPPGRLRRIAGVRRTRLVLES